MPFIPGMLRRLIERWDGAFNIAESGVDHHSARALLPIEHVLFEVCPAVEAIPEILDRAIWPQVAKSYVDVQSTGGPGGSHHADHIAHVDPLAIFYEE